jgi:hypothetical protein
VATVTQAERTSGPRVQPDDQYNRQLVANVHPPGWVDPEPAARYTWW